MATRIQNKRPIVVEETNEASPQIGEAGTNGRGATSSRVSSVRGEASLSNIKN
jgi:hypothetical protein